MGEYSRDVCSLESQTMQLKAEDLKLTAGSCGSLFWEGERSARIWAGKMNSALQRWRQTPKRDGED